MAVRKISPYPRTLPSGPQSPQSGSPRSRAQAAKDTTVHYVRINSATYGTVLPLLYGTRVLSATILWYNDPSVSNFVSPTGSPISRNVIAIELGICEGPITAYRNTWQTGGSSGNGANVRYDPTSMPRLWDGGMYLGTYSDTVWSYLTANHPSDALAYRGIAHVATNDLALGNTTQLPQYTFEITGLLPFLGRALDAEPSAIIEDFLCDPRHGLAWPLSWLDLSGTFIQYQAANAAVGLLISPLLDSQKSAAEWINGWLAVTMAQATWSDGKLKILPFYDQPASGNGINYTPQLSPVIASSGPDDYVVTKGAKASEPITMVRQLAADKWNDVLVEFVNRAHDYQVEVVGASSLADITIQTQRTTQPTQYHEITTSLLATKIARMQLLRSLTVRNQYQFTLAQKYIYLEPLDIWPLTSPELGLTNYPVRLISIQLQQDETLACVAEDLGICNTTGLPSGGEQTGSGKRGGTNPNALQPVNVPMIIEPSQKITYGRLFLLFGISGQLGNLNWGGADIWWSEDQVTWKFLLRATAPAIQGYTQNSLPATGGGFDTTDTLQVDLSESGGVLQSISKNLAAGSHHNLFAISNADGTNLEFISFQTQAAGAGNNLFNLTGLARGLYGSNAVAHAAGSNFLFLNVVTHYDAGIFQWEYPARLLGQPIYFQFLSLDAARLTEQNLNDPTVAIYSYTPQGVGSTEQKTVGGFTVAPDVAGGNFGTVVSLVSKNITGQQVVINAFGTYTTPPGGADGKLQAQIIISPGGQALYNQDLSSQIAANMTYSFDISANYQPSRAVTFAFQFYCGGTAASRVYMNSCTLSIAVITPNTITG